jgi:hypothetical protein
MKTYLISMISCLFSILSYGQEWQWTTPIAVSDSVSDNRNATLSDIMMFNGPGAPLYMCWENSVNDASTAIWGRALRPMEPPFVIVSQPNVHFRNPRILKYNEGDTIFSVYFETDMNGNWDIYRVNYLTGGTLSAMIPVETTPDDETSFTADASFNYAWLRNGNVMAVKQGTPAVELGSGGCSSPVIRDNNCYWMKDSLIWNSTFESGNWTSPVSISSFHCRHLSAGNNTHPANMGYYLVYEEKKHGVWRLMDYMSMGQTDSLYDYPGFNNTSPSYCTVMIFTKKDAENPDGYNTVWPLTFASDSTGNNEIYASSPYYGNTDYQNLSQYAGIDDHPQLFDFFAGETNYMYDVWESYRNGHWQLWMTEMDISTGINDRSTINGLNIKINPNPFSGKVDIGYELSAQSVTSVVIKDIPGKQVITLKETGTESAGIHHLNWNATNSAGMKVPAGLYLCSVTVNGKTVCGKLLLK